MFISKKALPRRTFLRGAGAALALPWLDAMRPAMGAVSAEAAAPSRAAFLYVPHGVILDLFAPKTEGRDFAFEPIMKPLEPYRSHLTVITNLSGPPDGGSGHVGASASWLSGTSAKKTEAEDVRLGTTLDQVIAERYGRDTRVSSLELSTEDISALIGACDYGFSCTYLNTICWATPTTPLPMEVNPRLVFERLFGEATSPARRMAHLHADRSILDSITANKQRLSKALGASDRARIDDYLDNIREIERRIASAERQAETTLPVSLDAPVGVPEQYDDHVSLLLDLIVIAYQADLTRVATLMLGRELSNRTYPQAGVAEPHHAVSHHGNNPEIMQKHARINTYHVSLFARFLEKLRAIREGEGSLLDHSMIVYGSGMANGNLHSHNPLWLVLAGGANGLKGNRHIKAADRTPLGNALVGIAARANVPVDHMGMSDGHLEI
jgi:hypothetical protein